MHKQIKETFLIVENYFNKTESYITLENYRTSLFNFYKKIRKDILTLLENDNVSTNISVNELKGALNILENILLFMPINENFHIFIEKMLLLIDNFNNNIFKNSEIKSKILKLNRINEGFYSLKETIELNKKIINNLKYLKSWQPPSFELAKHYINLLKEKE